jgi:hypothetical protein
LQRGGFSCERDAAEALERALERLRRSNGVGSTLTLKELVDEYLVQHDAEPETIDKHGWLLAKAVRAFGGRRLREFRSQEIAACRLEPSTPSYHVGSIQPAADIGRARAWYRASRPVWYAAAEGRRERWIWACRREFRWRLDPPDVV